jgi:glycerophosphoryl diester phosphodiesterase
MSGPTSVRTTRPRRFGEGPPLAVAHRGDPARHPENTLEGIRSAVARGADVVEIDVKVTADGEVVLLHDDTLQRIWDVDADIRTTTSAELDRYVRPRGGAPTLAEGLAAVHGTGCALMVDMDAVAWAEPSVAVVRREVAAARLAEAEVTWCGRPASLQVVRDLDPRARIVLSWDEGNGAGGLPPDDVVDALVPEVFNPHWPMLNPAVFDWAHERGLATCCWTVDDPELMARLVALGVDGMISNRIDALTGVLHGRGAA